MKYKQVAAQYKQELDQLKQVHEREVQRLTGTIKALQSTLAAEGRKPSSEPAEASPGTPPPDLTDTSLTLPEAIRKYHAPQNSQPTLTLFCGLPGTGKTTLAKRLEQTGKGIRICTDDWQELLGIDHSNEEFHEKLQARLYELALALLRSGQDVILEDGLWQKSERSQKLADAKRSNARTEMYFFDLTFDEIWRRLEYRNDNLAYGAVPITRQQLESYWEIFQRPDEHELRLFDAYTIYH
jgi:predicted kinase